MALGADEGWAVRRRRSAYGVKRDRFWELSHDNQNLIRWVERSFQIKVVAVDIRSEVRAVFHLADNTRVVLDRERSATASHLNWRRVTYTPWKARRMFNDEQLGDEIVFEN